VFFESRHRQSLPLHPSHHLVYWAGGVPNSIWGGHSCFWRSIFCYYS
jgi:hypothetical protein